MKCKFVLIAAIATFFILASGSIVNAQTTPPPPVEEKSMPDDTKKYDEDNVFDTVEIEAKVEVAAWRKHLEKNLIAYIEDAARKGIKPGQFTINVRFLVERDGSISNVKAINDVGYNLARGAERVVRTGPKWIAGEQNGKKVRSYHTQPITFVIQEK